MRYYDPKTDVVFKKVFGEHKNLAMSLLNAVLQLEGKNQIKDLEYLPSEILPVMGGKRSSAVDVRCQDSLGDYFIVDDADVLVVGLLAPCTLQLRQGLCDALQQRRGALQGQESVFRQHPQ